MRDQRAEMPRLQAQRLRHIGAGGLEIAKHVIHRGALVPRFREVRRQRHRGVKTHQRIAPQAVAHGAQAGVHLLVHAALVVLQPRVPDGARHFNRGRRIQTGFQLREQVVQLRRVLVRARWRDGEQRGK